MLENIKTINLKIDIKTLTEAIANCNLGMGTYDEPITADYFATNLDTDNSTIILNKKKVNIISFEVSDASQSGYTCELLGVFIYPTGRNETMLSTNNVAKLFNEIFNCNNSYINDRTLCIPVKENECNIEINALEKEEMDYYFTYRVLFKLEIDNIPYCFSIDPIFSARSRRRR